MANTMPCTLCGQPIAAVTTYAPTREPDVYLAHRSVDVNNWRAHLLACHPAMPVRSSNG